MSRRDGGGGRGRGWWYKQMYGGGRGKRHDLDQFGSTNNSGHSLFDPYDEEKSQVSDRSVNVVDPLHVLYSGLLEAGALYSTKTWFGCL